MITREALQNYKKLQKLIKEIAKYLIKIEDIPSRYEGRVFINGITSKNVYLLIFDSEMLDYLTVALPIDVIVNDTWKEHFDKIINGKIYERL